MSINAGVSLRPIVGFPFGCDGTFFAFHRGAGCNAEQSSRLSVSVRDGRQLLGRGIVFTMYFVGIYNYVRRRSFVRPPCGQSLLKNYALEPSLLIGYLTP